MNIADIAAHLQKQFSGQLVLYVPDIAKILGRSDKAIANLMSRNSLPFKVKLLGGLRCVDIFQVARWLASTSGAAEEVTQSLEVALPKPQKLPAKKLKAAQPEAEPSLPASLPPVAQQVLAMRHDFIKALERFAGDCQDDEQFFLLGIVEEMQGRGPRYRVTVSSDDGCDLHEKGSSLNITSHYILLDAEVELLNRLTSARYTAPKLPTIFVLEDGRHTLFRSVIDGCGFDVEVNKLQLYLPGL